MMIDVISLIISGLTLIGVAVLVRRREEKKEAPQPIPKQPPSGECAHLSSKQLKVTSMGDDEEYYLCKKCGRKVKRSELYYFEKGGI